MRAGTKKWLIWISGFALIAFLGLVVTAYFLSKRYEPQIREQTVQYLEKRFSSEAEITALRIVIPRVSPFRIILSGGSGTLAHIEGEGISLRHKGRPDIPPMFIMKRFTADVDLGNVFKKSKFVDLVTIEGMEINVPPKG